ncbi:unnamed protein product, partial [Mesorhabditis belari]|uniref:Uncharacterized protein n=1 Tax=Mesorhabditis belari TaxID=2138241 RepID=A0AAF3EEJ3_9BILA
MQILPKLDFTNSAFNNRASKIALITGGDGTIGHKFVEHLITRGWFIHVVTSSRTRAEDFFTSHGIPNGPATKLHFHECDLSKLDKVAQFVGDFKKENLQIDLVICNAGVLHPRDMWNDQAVADGMNVNVISHALMIESLHPVLARDNRILLVGSCCSHGAFVTKRMIKSGTQLLYSAAGPYQAYASSKLLLASYGGTINFVSVVPSGLYRNTNPITRFATAFILPFFLRNAEDAALLCLHTAFRDDLPNGSYCEDGKVVRCGTKFDKEDLSAIYGLIQKRFKRL